tara:strand:- start:27173 stop:28051 length:879 start_codon:yes stop_codon:yes gene_type:complete
MEALAELLEDALGQPTDILSVESVHGGCIHEALKLTTGRGNFFAKRSSLRDRGLLEAEARGLHALQGTQTIRTPTVIGCGTNASHTLLVLEWLDLSPLTEKSGALLGEQLADLHLSPASQQFGWDHDNFIGSTPQNNSPSEDWSDFFRDRRLLPQLEVAKRSHRTLPSPEPFLENLETFFAGEPFRPAPLHGDLWSGNAAEDSSGRPVVFDPAFYFGDPETDLAFSRYFGGFPPSFYQRYHQKIPTRQGWKIRATLYNLYHVLNHLNLFGIQYLAEAARMIGELNSASKGGS